MRWPWSRRPPPAPPSLARPDAGPTALWEHWTGLVAATLKERVRPIDGRETERELVHRVSASAYWRAAEAVLDLGRDVFGGDPRFPQAGEAIERRREAWLAVLKARLDPLHELRGEILSGRPPTGEGLGGRLAMLSQGSGRLGEVLGFFNVIGVPLQILAKVAEGMGSSSLAEQRRLRLAALVVQGAEAVLELACQVWDEGTAGVGWPSALELATDRAAPLTATRSGVVVVVVVVVFVRTAGSVRPRRTMLSASRPSPLLRGPPWPSVTSVSGRSGGRPTTESRRTRRSTEEDRDGRGSAGRVTATVGRGRVVFVCGLFARAVRPLGGQNDRPSALEFPPCPLDGHNDRPSALEFPSCPLGGPNDRPSTVESPFRPAGRAARTTTTRR